MDVINRMNRNLDNVNDEATQQPQQDAQTLTPFSAPEAQNNGTWPTKKIWITTMAYPAH